MHKTLHALLLFAVLCCISNAQHHLLIHGHRDEMKIALTFDACSPTRHPGYDSAVVRVLHTLQCKATLFLGGRWMERYPGLTRTLRRDPLFELGIHGYAHRLLIGVRRDSIALEIQRAQDVFVKLTGHRANLFRPPFALYDSAVLEVADSMRVTVVAYDIASGDPDTLFTAHRLAAWVISEARKGAIVVFHMNGRGWHTAEALPAIITTLRARGFQLVTVGELMRN